MVTFAGYDMPVQYDGGIIAESKAVRTGAGMFDVSHMARLNLVGERVFEYLEWVTTNDVSKLSDGVGQYSLLPNDQGGVVDDIIVYRLREHEYVMVVNAANHAKDVAWLNRQNQFDVQMTDNTDASAMIAVQGPRATEILAGLSGDGEAMRAAPLFGLLNTQISGVSVLAARSGYTGEDGFELICPAEESEKLWNALVEAGVVPCGLGARDVLRVEAGLPLYGHELTDELSPLTAGLGWVISKTKSFVGAEFVQAARASGTPTKLFGIKMNSRRIPAPDMVVSAGGRQIGSMSSGVYSPLLECGIGFAFLAPDTTIGQEITVNIRGAEEPGSVVQKRFMKRG